MTSSKQKGQKKEALAANELKKDGYTIVFKSCTVRRGPCWVGLDFADLFDVVGVKYKSVWRFVSCKHASQGHKKHREEIDDFIQRYALEGMSFEVWDWHKGKGWVKWIRRLEGWERVDERKRGA